MSEHTLPPIGEGQPRPDEKARARSLQKRVKASKRGRRSKARADKQRQASRTRMVHAPVHMPLGVE
jgi:hypothetical protein